MRVVDELNHSDAPICIEVLEVTENGFDDIEGLIYIAHPPDKYIWHGYIFGVSSEVSKSGEPFLGLNIPIGIGTLKTVLEQYFGLPANSDSYRVRSIAQPIYTQVFSMN